MTLASHEFMFAHVTPYRWTVDRYHRAVLAGVFEGQPLELLNGVVVEMSPEGIPHAGLISER